ncbi:LysR substrate-binding domain-containing protein [Prosthecobacter fluviatilis]|uniref:LysR substrate-binding domain-containing protein n=1 Tax=Prosthecobacter fluviatilis TaxID=445931 RepID=A0ABW0KXF0_9BACT
MELRHLRYFVAVAEALSFSRAATRLRLAQPSLSTQIRDLEEELGLQLLERNRNHVALTDAGTVFLREARAVLTRADKAVARAKEAAAGTTGELRVGSMGPLTISFLPACLTRLHAALPKARISVQETGPSDQLAQIAAGRVHIGFIPEIFAKLSAAKKLVVRNILRSPLIVLVSEHHPLARRGTVRLRELEDETFLHILMYGSDAQRVWTREICRSIGFLPQFGSAASNAENLVTMVAAGAGVALIPKIAERTGTPGCAALLVTDKSLHYDLCAVYDENFPSALRDTFLGIVEEEAKKVESQVAVR